MNDSEYAALDAVGIAALIKNGDVSASEITEKAIEVSIRMNQTLNAVVIGNYTNARQCAAMPLPDSPVSGAPIFLKDVNQFTHDMPTTFSSRFFESATAKEDSVLVKRWRTAGLNVLGKANTPEFAEDFVCEPTWRGPTLNPWNTKLTTGGSSGGAGAAVASGMVPVAHATDLGGSIRIPAACCGVFGLKPTTGLNPVGHAYAELASGLNADHVLSRSVRDSAALLDASAGPSFGTRYHVRPKVSSYLKSLDEPVPALKIGVCKTTPQAEPIANKQAEAVDLIANTLENMGHELHDYAYPLDLDLGTWMENLWMVDVVFEIENRIAELNREPNGNELEALTHYMIQHVNTLSAMDLYRARQRAHETGLKIMQSMHSLDLVLTPALGSDPVPVGYIDGRTDNFDFQTWANKGHAFAPFAYICNLSGQPAASLPVHLKTGEHPCAVQLAGHHCEDHVLLQVAATLEEFFQWHNHRPPIWAGHA